MTPNRVVVLLSPIFVGLAGWLATLAARYLPGHPHLDATGLAAVFIAGAGFAAAKVALWLKGWQCYEKHQAGYYGDADAVPDRSIVKRKHRLPKPAEQRPE